MRQQTRGGLAVVRSGPAELGLCLGDAIAAHQRSESDVENGCQWNEERDLHGVRAIGYQSHQRREDRAADDGCNHQAR